jgi:hypothetical protein
MTSVGNQLCFSVWASNASGESVRVHAALTVNIDACGRRFQRPVFSLTASLRLAAQASDSGRNVFISQNPAFIIESPWNDLAESYSCFVGGAAHHFSAMNSIRRLQTSTIIISPSRFGSPGDRRG